MAEVEFRKVTKIFPDGTMALKDFDLKIDDGEFVVIVGPSGCGKSTALRILAGLEPLSEGEIIIDGKRVNDRTPQERNIAMVFQNYALYPHKTVWGNLEFPLRMMGLPRDERAKRIRKTAAFLGLTDYLDRTPRQLSGGQRQRAAMGRALVRDPLVSLMDEPLSNLDAKMRVEIRAEMAELQRQIGLTTVYVTHDQVEAMTLGNRVAVLRQGRLQQCAAPRLIYDCPANVFVATFIGSPRMNIVRARLAQEAGQGDMLIEFGPYRMRFDAKRYEGKRDVVARHRGKPVLAGFRPEMFCRAEAVAKTFRLHGTVETIEVLGHEQVVYFTAPVDIHLPLDLDKRENQEGERSRQERSLVARLPASEPLKPGQDIELGLRAEEIYLFEENGQAF